MANVVFMGTPEFAVPSLQALDEVHKVVGVVTQPDRRAGRGRKLAASPVKGEAQQRGLPIYQPDSLRTPEAFAQLAKWQPDVIVVAAFGQILLPAVLDLPPCGCLNVHASLLPRYRGAAPIPAAILDGEPTTGATIMVMDPGLDTGDILSQAELDIAPDETTGTLTDRLADQGARLLITTLPGWLGGELEPEPQDHSLATYCRQLAKRDGLLDWTRTAVYLDRQVRAHDPWPGAFTTWQGKRLKVLRAQPLSAVSRAASPGEVVELEDGVGVVTGGGVLVLQEVQLAGKRAMPAATFARGQVDFVGAMLGAHAPASASPIPPL